MRLFIDEYSVTPNFYLIAMTAASLDFKHLTCVSNYFSNYELINKFVNITIIILIVAGS